MVTLLTALDGALGVLIMLAALDYLRAAQFLDRPLECVSFYLVALGAFAIVLARLSGLAPEPGALLLHAGITAYAAAHYHDIVECDWHWDGVDRRRAGH